MFEVPNDGHRHFITGMTGNGKTVFGLWMLSGRSFDSKPWILLDFKRDLIIEQIPHLTEIGLTDAIPKRRGLYVLRPDPADASTGAMTEWFYKLWRAEHTGLFIDECYNIKRFDVGLQAIMTQGRSKRIPVIALSQKPAWISPFIMSESEFKSIFYLFMPSDIDRIREWLPPRDDKGRAVDPSALPPHHSYWYCAHTREFARLGPCPDENAVLNIFDARRVRRYMF